LDGKKAFRGVVNLLVVEFFRRKIMVELLTVRLKVDATVHVGFEVWPNVKDAVFTRGLKHVLQENMCPGWHPADHRNVLFEQHFGHHYNFFLPVAQCGNPGVWHVE
jgi:hypothetical protein